MIHKKFSYDEYKDHMLSSKSHELHFDNSAMLCEELSTIIVERVVYNDKKIFDKWGSYYKPSEIVPVQHRLKPQFLGLKHISDFTDYPNTTISPMGAVELMTACESFVSNLLNKRIYRRIEFSFSMEERNGSKVLCIDYREGFTKSYFDKVYCKIVANRLRTIISKSDFWLCD